MKKHKAIKVVAIIGIFTLLLSCLPGCQRHKDPENIIDGPDPTVPPNTLTREDLGVTLSGLYMTQQGMARGPYYIYRQNDDGLIFKITDTDPVELARRAQNTQAFNEDEAHFYAFNKVLEEECASVVCLDDDSIVRELEAAIVEVDALRWDGWDKKGNPGLGTFDVADTGSSYSLYLTLSDGSIVTMHGEDICPDGWDTLFNAVAEIFEELLPEA